MYSSKKKKFKRKNVPAEGLTKEIYERFKNCKSSRKLKMLTVYMFLISLKRGKYTETHGSSIATFFGWSKDTIQRVIADLKSEGFIDVEYITYNKYKKKYKIAFPLEGKHCSTSYLWTLECEKWEKIKDDHPEKLGEVFGLFVWLYGPREMKRDVVEINVLGISRDLKIGRNKIKELLNILHENALIAWKNGEALMLGGYMFPGDIRRKFDDEINEEDEKLLQNIYDNNK